MFFKRIRYELRELSHSVQKLIKKYIELEERIKILEREKAATKTVVQKVGELAEQLSRYQKGPWGRC